MKGDSNMNFSFLLSNEGATGAGNNGGSMIVTIIMIVIMIGVFWFFSSRQKKQDQKDNAMRDALAVGDEVTTIGGIIGKVVSIKGETFVLETTKDKTKIRFLKAAIRTVDVKAEDIAAAVIAEDTAKDADQANEPKAEDAKSNN